MLGAYLKYHDRSNYQSWNKLRRKFKVWKERILFLGKALFKITLVERQVFENPIDKENRFKIPGVLLREF